MKTKLQKVAKRVLLLLLCAWLGLVLLAALFYPRLLYHPDRSAPAVTPKLLGADGYEELWLTAADGVRLHAWFVPAQAGRGNGKTLLVFHGNAGNLGTAAPRLVLYSRYGFDAFMVDYHGFGRSEGEISESNLYLDAEAAWRYLTIARGVAPGNIVILGYSLGGAVASWLAERRPEAAGLVLESTFTSLADIAAGLFPFLPCRLIVGDAFNTLVRLANIKMPLLVVHGEGDELVSFRFGEMLFTAHTGKKAFQLIGDDHNLGFLQASDRYGQALWAFAGTL